MHFMPTLPDGEGWETLFAYGFGGISCVAIYNSVVCEVTGEKCRSASGREVWQSVVPNARIL
jgi:hypothetical protein